MHNDIFEDGYYLGRVSADSSLLQEIALLEEDDIMAVAEEHIAHRGYEYYRSNCVMNWEEKDNIISATVSGSYDNHYEVTIFVDQDDILGVCNCPYADTCKHIVATLLQVKNQTQDTNNKKIVLKEEAIFIDELNHMSKEELVDLLVRFAPNNYKKSIVLKYISKDEVDLSLEKIHHLITYTLKGQEFMYDPDGLFVATSAYLDELAVHIKVAPLKTFEIVLFMVKEIQILEEEGYLYQDSCDWYSEADHFEYETFSEKILKMIQSVEDSRDQAQIFLKYIKFCESSDYFYCSYNKVKVRDKALLLQGLEEIKSLSFYNYIKEVLSYEQKLNYLDQLDTDRVAPEMVDVYLEEGDKGKAIAYVETLLSKRFKTDDAELLLQISPLKKMGETRLHKLLESAIVSRDFYAQAFVMRYMGDFEDASKLEALLKKHKIYWYYEYLKKNERVEEMHDILSEVSGVKKDFYHRYKIRYKDEAIAYYKANINENLEFTGNNYYKTTAYFLKELKPLLSKEEFSNIIMNLKTHYKRRRNFVKILRERF